MKQLMFIEPGRLEWREIDPPRMQAPDDALVKPVAVARCDLDTGLLKGIAPFRGKMLHYLRNHLPEAIGQRGIFRNAPLKGPFPFGHECVAEVVEVGPKVKDRRPGDLVIVSFQISCGECAFCTSGRSNACSSVPPRSAYGLGDVGGLQWGGTLTDLVRVPFANHMLIPLPSGIDPVSVASLADNISDGYRAVADALKRFPGAKVLVVGGLAQSVGLFAAGAALALGASQVDYLDTDPQRIAVAKALGANVIESAPPASAGQYAVTVDASANVPGLHCAISSTEPGGICTCVAPHFTKTTPLPLRSMYGNGVTFVTGRVNALSCIHETLGLVCSGSFDPGLVTTHLAVWEEADTAFLKDTPKVVVARREYLDAHHERAKQPGGSR